MFKILKWSVVGLLVLTGGAWLVFGSHAGSYVHTAASEIRKGIHEQIGVEFELKRAESLIREVEPQLHRAKRQVAQAEVDLERTQEEIEDLEQKVAAGDRKLRQATASVGGDGGSGFALADLASRRAELRLERLFDSHRHNVELLETKRALAERQQRTVEASRARLDSMRVEKARLEDTIVALRTQKRNQDAMAATARSVELDATPLRKAREVLDDIKNRLAVNQKMIEADRRFDVDPVQEPDRNVRAEIQEWYRDGGDAASAGRGGSALETIEIR